MTTPTKTPLLVHVSQIILGLLALFYILYVGQGIILPLIYALILAIILNPLTNFFCRFGLNRVLAILFTLVIFLLLLYLVFYFIISQSSRLSASLPLLEQKLNQLLDGGTQWVAHTFKIDISKVNQWIAKTRANALNNFGSVVGSTLLTLTGIITIIILLPVYIFMLLFYKPLLLEFISKLFPKGTHAAVAEVLVQTKRLIQSYLFGLMIEAAIVAALNSIGLLILGIPYAFLLGTLGAIINMIPFIGGILSIALPVFMALATRSPSAALWVIGIYLVIQFIDNHYLVPKVVASKVRINALISIVVVLIGGALWGVAGMFVAIPLTAIIKVIFDRIEGLQPLGFLIGDTMPPIGKIIFKFKTPKPIHK